LKSKDISLFCEKPLSDVDVTIIVDEVRLKQILGNLLHNALKFTEKGYVQFGYKKTNNDFLQLFVKDTGIGIAPEKHAIVFEHFRQEDDTTIRKYGGTGLGLSISKRLIELMNGTMYVESEKGKGATFYVNVPFIQVYESEQDNAISHISLQEYTHFNGEYILVCDDYASSFVFISEMLEDENIHVLQAKSGEEAIEICKNSPTAIDLVLMDIQMAGMNGIDAMHTIKKINPTIPVIAQTAFAQKGDRERFLLEGFDEYITKPLDERELHSIIKRLLKIKRG
ncbi:MAG TPA: ATP-binding protein, partial [Bacteroidales bacterium]|nr:ATP-binding protein [Bacteroidales bacterium]